MIEIGNYPCIPIPDKLEDIFLLDSVNNFRNKLDTYEFNGIPVPRVSNILKECIGKDYLINWAAKLGRRQYIIETNRATTIGTRVHEMIENYLLNGTDLDVSFTTSASYMSSVNMAYSNFKNWIKYINNLGYYIEEIVATEKAITCPYYGGTIDCICKINGRYYIVDFKTSKQISYEYIIQTCAYMWVVNNGYCKDLPHIDGIGIIRVDKNRDKFEDLFLNENIEYQKNIIDQYIVGFGSLLSSYYNNINMKYIFSTYKKQYNIDEVL